MNAKKRFTAVGFIATITMTLGPPPVALAAGGSESDVVAFYLRGTCLCNTVPVAQEALGLANGYLGDTGTITGVGYPAGLLFALDSAYGATAVNSHLSAVPDGVTVTLAGVSQGAMALNYVKQSLALRVTPRRPTDELSFVTFGDPTNATGGIVAKNPLLWLSVPLGPLPTQYNTTEIVREYDGLADWPDRPTPLSVINAAMGVAYVHPFYGAEADPTVPGTVKTIRVNAVGGTTTHYLVPTADLPITRPLRDAGIDTTVIDRWLRPQINGAYDRRPGSAAAVDAPTTAATSAGVVASGTAAPTTKADDTVRTRTAAVVKATTDTIRSVLAIGPKPKTRVAMDDGDSDANDETPTEKPRHRISRPQKTNRTSHGESDSTRHTDSAPASDAAGKPDRRNDKAGDENTAAPKADTSPAEKPKKS